MCAASLQVLTCLLGLHVASLLSNSCFSPLFPDLIPPTHTRPTPHAPAPAPACTLFLGHTGSFLKRLRQPRQGLSASPTCPFSASSRHLSPPLAVTSKLNKTGYFGRGAAAGWGRRVALREAEAEGAAEREGERGSQHPSSPTLPAWELAGSYTDPSLYRIFLSLSNNTIPCFTIYHVLLQTSRYLHGALPLLQVCSNASSSMSPTLTTIEKGSPSPSILYLPHSALFFPRRTCHPLMYNAIYLYVLFTCLLLTEL